MKCTTQTSLNGTVSIYSSTAELVGYVFKDGEGFLATGGRMGVNNGKWFNSKLFAIKYLEQNFGG